MREQVRTTIYERRVAGDLFRAERDGGRLRYFFNDREVQPDDFQVLIAAHWALPYPHVT